MQLLKREGFLGRVAIGLAAGVISILFIKIDQIEFIGPIHGGNSAFNYTAIIIMFYILFVMNFVAGIKREYETSLTYIFSMALVDVLTSGLATILFAGISLLAFLLGLIASGIIRMFSPREEVGSLELASQEAVHI